MALRQQALTEPATLRSALEERFSRDLPRWLEQNLDPIEVNNRYWSGAYVLEGLPQAFYCFLRSPADFRETLLQAVNSSRDMRIRLPLSPATSREHSMVLERFHSPTWMIWSSGRTWTIWLTLYCHEAKTLFRKRLVTLFPTFVALANANLLLPGQGRTGSRLYITLH